MGRSRLTYSCQMWNVTQHQQERIDATYTNMIQKIIRWDTRGKTKQQNTDPDQEHDVSYILTNKDVLNICTAEAVSNYVNVQQAKYLAHLARHKHIVI